MKPVLGIIFYLTVWIGIIVTSCAGLFKILPEGINVILVPIFAILQIFLGPPEGLASVARKIAGVGK